MSNAAESTAEVIEDMTAGWKVRQIQEVADVNPRIDKKAIPDNLEVSFVPMPAVKAESGQIDVSVVKLAKQVKKGFTAFLEGDVLFAKITPCMENGKMAIAPALINDYGFGSTEFHVLRAGDDIDAKYLYYYVSSKSFRGEAERFMTGAVGQKRVSTTYIKEATIPVAPLEDQRRIVAEIEKQFSRLDEAVANLKRVKANLKRYKAAVLKAAVEGKLTEEWRKQNPDVEPASKLLDRILAERRKLWEKMVTICNRPKKYVEPEAVDANKLPVLPSKWVWVGADQISDFITKGTTPKKSKLASGDGEVQFLKVYNLTFDGSLNSDYKPAFVSKQTHDSDLARSKVFAGDVLINIVGPPLGQVSIVPPTVVEANMNQAIGRFRPVSPLTPDYLAIALRATSVMDRAIVRAKTTAGQSNLTLAICRELPIPLPPVDEQREILVEVDRLLSINAGLEKDVDDSLLRAVRLRQSTLSKAFSGALKLGLADAR